MQAAEQQAAAARGRAEDAARQHSLELGGARARVLQLEAQLKARWAQCFFSSHYPIESRLVPKEPAKQELCVWRGVWEWFQ